MKTCPLGTCMKETFSRCKQLQSLWTWFERPGKYFCLCILANESLCTRFHEKDPLCFNPLHHHILYGRISTSTFFFPLSNGSLRAVQGKIDAWTVGTMSARHVTNKFVTGTSCRSTSRCLVAEDVRLQTKFVRADPTFCFLFLSDAPTLDRRSFRGVSLFILLFFFRLERLCRKRNLPR